MDGNADDAMLEGGEQVADLIDRIEDRLDVLLAPVARTAVVKDRDSQPATPARVVSTSSRPAIRRQAIRTTV